MKKALMTIVFAVFLLCLTACAAPAVELKPTAETPTPTPAASPRTAEEVLPPIEKSIFPDGRGGIYMSSVSAGPDNLVVVLADGSLVCRGEVCPGRVGEPGESGLRKVLYTEEDFNYVSCSQFDSFLIDEDGVLWGSGLMSSWGNITVVSNTSPRPYRLLTDVQMASADGGSYLALRGDGRVWMWGRGEYGQLGKGEEYTKYSIINPLLEPVKTIENCVYASLEGARCRRTSPCGYGDIWDLTLILRKALIMIHLLV